MYSLMHGCMIRQHTKVCLLLVDDVWHVLSSFKESHQLIDSCSHEVVHASSSHRMEGLGCPHGRMRSTRYLTAQKTLNSCRSKSCWYCCVISDQACIWPAWREWQCSARSPITCTLQISILIQTHTVTWQIFQCIDPIVHSFLFTSISKRWASDNYLHLRFSEIQSNTQKKKTVLWEFTTGSKHRTTNTNEDNACAQQGRMPNFQRARQLSRNVLAFSSVIQKGKSVTRSIYLSMLLSAHFEY